MFVEQTKGFEELSEDGTKLVYKLKKCLYGLKQSGDDVMVLVVWVDDLIIASNNLNMINMFKGNMKSRFRMKDFEFENVSDNEYCMLTK